MYHLLLLAVWSLSGLGETANQASPMAGQQENPSVRPWAPIAKIDNESVKEISGVVRSRKYPGVFWAHADSGGPPEIVAFKLSGEILAKIAVSKAPNSDWEDITADDQGNLYIGDIGNNTKMFPARYIYKLTEPNPYEPPSDPVVPTARYRYKYPKTSDNQKAVRFDAEGLFWHSGKLYLMPKGTSRAGTLFGIQPDAEDVTLENVGRIGIPFPTGADVSEDGKKLLVCDYASATLFPLQDGELLVDRQHSCRITFPHSGIESCCFDGKDAVLISENGDIYRITAEELEAEVRYVKKARP